ncbi:MAG: flagellin [Myxococcales bacterium]|nr:flagellin [Myxococcota bacterium]MDW8280513.1 flagellin [Myxococcales bacterium]
MPISIYSNISSLDAQMHLGKTQMQLDSNMARLASGLRVNRAVDDAAGLGISTMFHAQIRSYAQGERNANDGISLLQTAEGALQQVHTILTRMRELAVQSANGTYGAVDRANIVAEVQQLQAEIDRIANSTRFGNVQMLHAAVDLTLQVGIHNTSADQISISLIAADAASIGVDAAMVKVDTQADAQDALAKIDAAIGAISAQRANIGALQSRISMAHSNDMAFRLNLSAATSRIRDVDVASETAEMARNNVLMQAGVAVLVQANQAPQAALALLRG